MGPNWLAKYKVTLDCEKKLITFSAPEGERIELKENSLPTYLGERELHTCRRTYMNTGKNGEKDSETGVLLMLRCLGSIIRCPKKPGSRKKKCERPTFLPIK